MVSRLLVLVALAVCVASAVALPIHQADQALIEHDPTAAAAAAEAARAAAAAGGAVAPPAAPVAGAVHQSRQCAAAGGDCIDTAAAGVTCAAPGVIRPNLCNGSASTKCCVTRPANPALNVPKAGVKITAGVKKPSKGHKAPAGAPKVPAKVAPHADRCHAAGGRCADSATNTCSTPFRSGLCNGGATVKCCVGTVAASAAGAPKTTPAKSNVPAKTTPAKVTPAGDRCAAIHGTCVDSTKNTCSTPFRSGLCAGAAGNKCCVGTSTAKPASTPAKTTPAGDRCAAVHGTCVDSTKNTCSTPFRSGLCAGAAGNKCCVGTSTAKPASTPAVTPSTSGKPSFETLRNCYPQGSADEVKARIGGAVNGAWITNTCAIRMSETLNCAGKLIPQMGGESIKGKNSHNYIFRVKQLGPFVKRLFGKGQTFRAPTGRGVPLSALAGKRGIIMFDTTGAWDDATGHFDLWDGKSMVENSHQGDATAARYFGLSVAITIWEF